jgi:broad specificity phosphatase PhoE
MSTKKIVYYMRHFQALHNIPPYNYNLHDPELSSLGQTQAKSAIEIIENISSIDLIVCSPLIRTLQTYLLIFHHRKDLPLIIHPDLQEISSEPCDIGSSLVDLHKKFSNLSNELKIFEQTFGDHDWLDKINPESIYSSKQIKQRTKRFHQWLMNRSEEHIFVISHHSILNELLTSKIDLKND